MSEKKTFKNPSSVINSFEPEHTWLVEGFRIASNYFTHREWDMEVTFTKKAPVFQKGDRVAFTEYGYHDEYTVEHQRDAHVWVFDDEGDFEVMNAGDLTKI